ncbi:MAG: hypothetical protein AB7O96_08925 [Pseudobdellovibrionaceae bacterium]
MKFAKEVSQNLDLEIIESKGEGFGLLVLLGVMGRGNVTRLTDIAYRIDQTMSPDVSAVMNQKFSPFN